MLRVSTRARYALRLMLDVARNGRDDAPISLSSVAKRTAISRGYLEQVALSLRSASLLRGVCGRRGGYHLGAPAEEITVGRIFEALIGPISLVDCIDSPSTCARSDGCECRVLYRLINDRIVEVLQSHTLADLMDPEWVRTYGDLIEGDGRQLLDGFGCNPVKGEKRTESTC